MRKSGFLVIARALSLACRNPVPLLSGLGMSLFFLVVYDAALGGIGALPEFGGTTYLAYLLPMGIVSLVFASSAGSAQALSRDIASRYFFRLALTPIPRSSFVLAAILAGMLEGLEAGIEPPAPLVGNGYENEAPSLSPSMAEAVARFSSSPFIAKAFGEEYRRVYGVMKAEELAAFSRVILPLEYDTYL